LKPAAPVAIAVGAAKDSGRFRAQRAN